MPQWQQGSFVHQQQTQAISLSKQQGELIQVPATLSGQALHQAALTALRESL